MTAPPNMREPVGKAVKSAPSKAGPRRKTPATEAKIPKTVTPENYERLPEGHPLRLEMAMYKQFSTGEYERELLRQGVTLVYESEDEKYIIKEHPDGRKYRRVAKPNTKFEPFHEEEDIRPIRTP